MTGGFLLVALLLTGVSGGRGPVFFYSRLGGGVLLPCAGLQSADCSLVSWTFNRESSYTEEVRGGQVRPDSHKSGRLSLTSSCSLSFTDLRVDDAGAYQCLQDGQVVADVYLSVLSIASESRITELQPGRNLSLHCVLFFYLDFGCKLDSNSFNVSWTAAGGAAPPADSRYELIGRSRCNVTLVTNLQKEDNNRKWRCQVTTENGSRGAFLDFTSTFLFEDPPTAGQPVIGSGVSDCPALLPVGRIVLCAALPVMALLIVGFFSWREDRQRTRRPAAGLQLQEVH